MFECPIIEIECFRRQKDTRLPTIRTFDLLHLHVQAICTAIYMRGDSRWVSASVIRRTIELIRFAFLISIHAKYLRFYLMNRTNWCKLLRRGKKEAKNQKSWYSVTYNEQTNTYVYILSCIARAQLSRIKYCPRTICWKFKLRIEN